MRASYETNNSNQHFSVVINNDSELAEKKPRVRHLEIIRQDVDEIGSGLLSSPAILYTESPQRVSQSSPSLGLLDDLITFDHSCNPGAATNHDNQLSHQ